jgi:hypothetical protein
MEGTDVEGTLVLALVKPEPDLQEVRHECLETLCEERVVSCVEEEEEIELTFETVSGVESVVDQTAFASQLSQKLSGDFNERDVRRVFWAPDDPIDGSFVVGLGLLAPTIADKTGVCRPSKAFLLSLSVGHQKLEGVREGSA